MLAECRYAPALQEYLLKLKVGQAEVTEFLNPVEFTARVERLLADKISQELFLKLSPSLTKAMRDMWND